MAVLGLIFTWFIFSIIAGVVASNKGRSGLGFFILSLVLSPLIGLIAALAARPNKLRLEKEQIASGERRKCPYCAELIRPEAVICPHCGKDVPESIPEKENFLIGHPALIGLAVIVVFLAFVMHNSHKDDAAAVPQTQEPPRTVISNTLPESVNSSLPPDKQSLIDIAKPLKQLDEARRNPAIVNAVFKEVGRQTKEIGRLTKKTGGQNIENAFFAYRVLYGLETDANTEDWVALTLANFWFQNPRCFGVVSYQPDPESPRDKKGRPTFTCTATDYDPDASPQDKSKYVQATRIMVVRAQAYVSKIAAALSKDEAAEESNAKGYEAKERKNYVEALSWFRKAADEGSSKAENNIGSLYEDGLGVQKDYDEAMRWYKRAADHGLAAAQNNIGTMYEGGLGVPKDYVEAMRWYHKAADQGLAAAQYKIGALYTMGRGVQKDDSEAIRWYRKAAEQGLSVAQYLLGVHYQNGAGGVTKDNTQARYWYGLAASQGEENAKSALAELDNSSTPADSSDASGKQLGVVNVPSKSSR